ncbi:hypothetical protein [Nitrobacter winogradskyi]|uniref:Uncharacterized protein n=1 Tax=Nitrobacter winogradskyi TaxID=913 RepID=A0ACC6AJG4_NITWI|nr:hypothetical protein [Nitrobacter winogradskyi]MCP1999332.1 hypothetical protein [Nitrobacter winogradskyi]
MRSFSQAGARNHVLVCRLSWFISYPWFIRYPGSSTMSGRGFVVVVDGSRFARGALKALQCSLVESQTQASWRELIRRVFFTRTGFRFDRKRYRQLLPGRLLINEMSILAGRRHLRPGDRSIGHEEKPHA